MLRFINYCTPATFAAYLALNTTPKGPFHAVLLAVAAGFVTTLIWTAIHDILKRMHRIDRDAALMQGGYCPACENPRTLEVTSERGGKRLDGTSFRETDIRCNACEECFTISASKGGPLVKRHGKGYTHDHD